MGKIIIAGSGRAGTSFLMRIFTRLGLDTGFTPENEDWNINIRAGCEYTAGMKLNNTTEETVQIFNKLPRILKAPDFSFFLKKFILLGVPVEHVIIPIRDMKEAVQSRLNAGLRWLLDEEGDDFQRQLLVCYSALGSIIETCTLYNIPFTILKFPELVKNSDYLKKQLDSCLPEMIEVHQDRFDQVFQSLQL